MNFGYSSFAAEKNFFPAMPFAAANAPKESQDGEQRALFQDPWESVHKSVLLVLSTPWTAPQGGQAGRTNKLLEVLFGDWIKCRGLVVPLLEEILAEWEKSRGTGTSAKGGCDSALAQRAFFDTYDPEGEEGGELERSETLSELLLYEWGTGPRWLMVSDQYFSQVPDLLRSPCRPCHIRRL